MANAFIKQYFCVKFLSKNVTVIMLFFHYSICMHVRVVNYINKKKQLRTASSQILLNIFVNEC